MKNNPVGWFEIYVQDMLRARAFYEAVFGGSLTKLDNPDQKAFAGMEMMAFPASREEYGAPGALVKMPGCPSGGSTMVYFSCADCAVEAGRVAPAGGKVEMPKTPIGPYGFIAHITDTEGNGIGLHSMA